MLALSTAATPSAQVRVRARSEARCGPRGEGLAHQPAAAPPASGPPAFTWPREGAAPGPVPRGCESRARPGLCRSAAASLGPIPGPPSSRRRRQWRGPRRRPHSLRRSAGRRCPRPRGSGALGGDHGLPSLAVVPAAQSERPGPLPRWSAGTQRQRRNARGSRPVPAPRSRPPPYSFPRAPPRSRPRALSVGGARTASRTRERRGWGARRALPAAPAPAPARRAGHAPGSGCGAHPGLAMRSGAERRGSSASAPPGSPPPGRARPAGPDTPLALQPSGAGQTRARDSGDGRAQPRPLFAWSKWKKRMGSSMSAATARRPVFDDREDGEFGRAPGPRRRSGDSVRTPRPRGGRPSPGGSVSEETRAPFPRRPRVPRARLRPPCPVAACPQSDGSGFSATLPDAACGSEGLMFSFSF